MKEIKIVLGLTLFAITLAFCMIFIPCKDSIQTLKTCTDTFFVLQYIPINAPDTLHLERATTYQPTTEQCDSNPLSTADGSIINPDSLQRWVALSRDLISRWGGPFNYGDSIYFYSETKPHINGYWELHDCMASRYKLSVDFLLDPKYNIPKLGICKDVKIIYHGNSDTIIN